MFNIGSKTTISRRYGGGESSDKFSSFYCIYYTYTLYKPPPPQVEPATYPALLVLNLKSQHMLGLYTTFIIYNIYSRSFGRVY